MTDDAKAGNKADDLPDTQPTEVMAGATTDTSEVAKAGRAAGTSATMPLPVQAEEEPVVVLVPAKKKRRRWPWVLGGILLVLAVLLVIAFFVADAYAKDYARAYIKERIVAVLGIDDPSQVKVDIGAGSVLLQALAGKLNQVDVTAGPVSFGILNGAATVHAEGVPLDQNAPVERWTSRSRSPRPTWQLWPVTSAASSWKHRAGRARDRGVDHLQLLRVPDPGRHGHRAVGGRREDRLHPDQHPLGRGQLSPPTNCRTRSAASPTSCCGRTICVAESLPVALTIVDVDVVKKDLIVKINGDGTALGGADLSTPGTCAA